MIKIQLIEDWKAVLTKSWSNRLAYLSLLAMAAEQLLPLMSSLPAEYKGLVPSWLPVVLMAGAVYARVVRQEKLSGPAIKK